MHWQGVKKETWKREDNLDGWWVEKRRLWGAA
jgi:hypothetical protein